jgi:hypothetical protein
MPDDRYNSGWFVPLAPLRLQMNVLAQDFTGSPLCAECVAKDYSMREK